MKPLKDKLVEEPSHPQKRVKASVVEMDIFLADYARKRADKLIAQKAKNKYVHQ